MCCVTSQAETVCCRALEEATFTRSISLLTLFLHYYCSVSDETRLFNSLVFFQKTGYYFQTYNLRGWEYNSAEGPSSKGISGQKCTENNSRWKISSHPAVNGTCLLCSFTQDPQPCGVPVFLRKNWLWPCVTKQSSNIGSLTTERHKQNNVILVDAYSSRLLFKRGGGSACFL